MVEPPHTHSKLPCSPASPAGKWFEEVWCGRTTPYSFKPAQQACFPLHDSGSKRLGIVEPPPTHSNLPCSRASPFFIVIRGGSVYSNLPNSLEPSLYACISLRHSGSGWFGEFEPLQTHSNLPCRPASPYITVVRGGSVWSNHPELIRTFPVCLHPPSSQWFGEVEPPQTHSNLPCRPASPYITVVREGSVQLNLPELTPNCPSDQLPPSSQWFEEVRCGRTTPNSLKIAL